MVSAAETADLLEKAADLYESEQVEWCKRTWAGIQAGCDSHKELHCAEGALLRAAGFSFVEITLVQSAIAGTTRSVVDLLREPRVSAAMSAVTVARGAGIFDGGMDRLWSWNDSLPQDTAKQTIIDTFKETAKGLRNHGGS